MTEEVSNKELEDLANELCEDFDRICEKEDSRMKENGLLYGTTFDNEEYDLMLNYSRASFKLKKEDLKEYVYVDKLSYCKEGCVDEYINRTYKFIRMEGELSAIFYRDY